MEHCTALLMTLPQHPITAYISGSSLAVVTSRSREPVMPSNYTIVQYFSSFIEDPLFESLAVESSYSKAKKCYEEKVR